MLFDGKDTVKSAEFDSSSNGPTADSLSVSSAFPWFLIVNSIESSSPTSMLNRAKSAEIETPAYCKMLITSSSSSSEDDAPEGGTELKGRARWLKKAVVVKKQTEKTKGPKKDPKESAVEKDFEEMKLKVRYLEIGK